MANGSGISPPSPPAHSSGTGSNLTPGRRGKWRNLKSAWAGSRRPHFPTTKLPCSSRSKAYPSPSGLPNISRRRQAGSNDSRQLRVGWARAPGRTNKAASLRLANPNCRPGARGFRRHANFNAPSWCLLRAAKVAQATQLTGTPACNRQAGRPRLSSCFSAGESLFRAKVAVGGRWPSWPSWRRRPSTCGGPAGALARDALLIELSTCLRVIARDNRKTARLPG